MIIDDLDVERASLFPPKADPPSFVDPDAVLTLPVPLQGLESVTRRRVQVPQRAGAVKIHQFPPRRSLEGLESSHGQIVEQVLGFSVFEGLDHGQSLLHIASYFKSNMKCVSRMSLYMRQRLMRGCKKGERGFPSVVEPLNLRAFDVMLQKPDLRDSKIARNLEAPVLACASIYDAVCGHWAYSSQLTG